MQEVYELGIKPVTYGSLFSPHSSETWMHTFSSISISGGTDTRNQIFWYPESAEKWSFMESRARLLFIFCQIFGILMIY